MELKIPSKFEDLYFDEAGEYGYDLISQNLVATRNLQVCDVDCPDRFGVSLDDSPSDRDLQLSEALSGISLSNSMFSALLNACHSYSADFVDTCKSIGHSQLTNGVINQNIFTLIKNFDSLSAECKASLVEDLSELVKLTLDELSSGKPVTDTIKHNGKKTLFYFIQLVIKAEDSRNGSTSTSSGADKASKTKSSKKKSSGSFDWAQEQRKKCLTAFKDIVTSEIGQLWTMGIVEEPFLKSIWSYCLDLLVERPAGIAGNGNNETSSRSLAIHIIGNVVRHFGGVSTSGSYCALSTAILDGIIRMEHMAVYAGEICHQEKVQSSHDSHSKPIAMTMELVAEISKMNLGLVSAQGVKNISSFIESYAKADPDSFSLFIPTMIKQVDSPAHQMRSAMIQAMGHVIEYIREVIATPIGDNADSKPSFNNRHALLRQRDDLLNILVERTHDINPYTRASLLKVWAALIDSNAVPVKRMGSIAEVALDRLFDKNSFVRRSALALFTSLVDGNPFTGKLDMAIFEQQKTELEKLIEIRLQELSETMASKLAAEAEKAELRKKRAEEGGKSASEEEEEEEALDEDELFADAEADEIMVDLRAKHDYVSSATEFMKAIGSALTRIAEMLESKNVSDVVEAIGFFGRAINFQVHGALEEFTKAFKLIWHTDASVRQELQTVFIQVYFTDGAKEHAKLLSPREIAINLTHVIASCEDVHLTSLEEILGELSAQPSLVGFDFLPLEEWLQALLDLGLHPPTTPLTNDRSVSYLSAGMYAISMLTARTHEKHVDVLVQFVPNLLSAGLGEDVLNKRDLDTIRYTIAAVTKIYKMFQVAVEKKGGATLTASLNPALLQDALISMQKVITWAAFLSNDTVTQAWFSTCEEAIQAIFQLHESPEVVMDRIIHFVHASLFAEPASSVATAEEAEAPAEWTCTQSQLAAFFFILGQTAVNIVVYVEDIAAKVKRRLRENIESGKTVGHEGDKAPTAGAENNISDFEEQMGVAAAMDAEHDQEVHVLIEKELVLSNLLGAFLPLVTYVAANDQRQFSAPVLHDTAVLTLCRFATVSSVACEQSLPLIFTILERQVSNAGLRTTITVALGDLAFRFPNTFEPWTNHLYARLSDDNVDVRYNTLVVITHLVLNDMIKVKGQVSHVAMALNDTEPRIRDLARLFFIKLSERSNNPVFNLLGDIISNFSRDDATATTAAEEATNGVVVPDTQLKSQLEMPTLTEEAFQQTMHFMLSFVQKDKHADMLLERLLIRLGAAETIRQRRYLAYCISELTVTEKGLKKLVEMIK